jgi:aminoglycoside N3'-acetyltransferase
MKVITLDSLVQDLNKMGVQAGDTLFVRAALGKVGRVEGGGEMIISSLLKAIGPSGTLVSLAFTRGFFIRPSKDYVFDLSTESYAGALPNIMLKHPEAKRSRHPMNSIVAIGANADLITDGHDESSSAYEPIRHLVNLNAKMMLIGCVDSSPGFTTTHLAEQDLKHYRYVIFPKLNCVYYKNKAGKIKLFRRPDLGLCSNSFRKFYSYYVDHEILISGYFGNAYSICVPANNAYAIERKILEHNPRFNICDNPECQMCNFRRWDRLYKAPGFLFRKIFQKIKKTYLKKSQ